MRYALAFVFVILATVARADEPQKYYLIDGKVTTETRVKELERKVAELETKFVELKKTVKSENTPAPRTELTQVCGPNGTCYYVEQPAIATSSSFTESCPGGVCHSPSRTGWYPGKLLRR